MAEPKNKEVLDLHPLFIIPYRPPAQVPGTINETRRAQAGLAGAESGRFVYRSPSSDAVQLTNISQPSTGRAIRQVTAPPNFFGGKGTTPITYLDFFNKTGDQLANNPFGVRRNEAGQIYRNAAPNLANNARFQLFKYNLGQAVETVDAGQFKGQGTTDSRKALYSKLTGGAIGPTGSAQVRPDGTWQPRDQRGRLGTAKPNPSDRLQAGLRALATAKTPVVRKAAPVLLNMLNVHPAIKTFMNVEDVLKQTTGKTITERTRDQLTKLLKVAPKTNLGPLLPF